MFPIPFPAPEVIHRVGGLEVDPVGKQIVELVIHRVGGLEAFERFAARCRTVIHRVGGLEVSILLGA